MMRIQSTTEIRKAAHGMRGSRPARRCHRRLWETRAAFTLVELLVVIGILLLIAAITVSAVNISVSGDRVRGAGRQVQSYLEGARSRAVYLKKNVGVRFIPELPSWQAGAAYRLGDKVLPYSAATGYCYRATAVTGTNTSGTTEPTWPSGSGAVGNTVTDNNVTWTCVADPILVASMVYVEPQPKETQGLVTIGRADTNLDGFADSAGVRIIRGYGTRWRALFQNGLLINGARIKLPADSTGRYYTVLTSSLMSSPANGPEILVLSTDYTTTPTVAFERGMSGTYGMPPSSLMGPDMQTGVASADDDGNGTADDNYEWQWPGSDDLTDVLAFDYPTNSSLQNYELELTNSPMANQDPRSLGNGAVIDLSLSRNLASLISTPQQMDVMFSPRGTVVGPLSGTGIVEFVLSDREDSLNQIPLPNTTTPNPAPRRDRLIVSLTPQTGMTAVHPIYIQPVGGTPDPFRYAETGEVASK